MNFLALLRPLLAKPTFLYVNVVLCFFLLNGICARAAWRLDLSQDQVNSVSPSTARVFQSLTEPVLLEAYISVGVTGEISSGIQPLISILYEMERIAGGKLKLRVYNPDDEDLRKQAEEKGIRGIQIAEQKDVSTNVRLGYFGLYLQKGDKNTTITLLDRNWFVNDLEYRVLREIKRFDRGKEKSGIAILEAPGAVQIRAWSQRQDQSKDNLFGFKTTLEKELGDVQQVSLDAPVPAAVRLLVLTGLPRLEDKEVYYLDQFLLRGGNVICMLSSFNFQMQAANPRLMQLGLAGATSGSLGMATVAKEELEKLNTWLSKYGVSLKGEVLLEPSQPMPVWDFQGKIARQIPYPAWAVYTRQTGNIVGDHPALQAIQQLVFPWFSSLDVKAAVQPKVSFQTLVKSSASALSTTTLNLGYSDVLRFSQAGQSRLGYQASLAVLAKGAFKSAYLKAKLPVGVDRALHLKEQADGTEANLVVIGTPYLVSDIMLRDQTGASVFGLNSAFLINLLEAIEGDTDLLAARSRKKTLSSLVVESEALKTFLSWSFSLGLPLFLAFWGASRLMGRNRKRGLEAS